MSLLITLYSLSSAASNLSSDIASEQRGQFVEVEKQLASVSYDVGKGLIEPLQLYPLYPYLQYQLYQRFPERLSQNDINDFFDQYPLLPKRYELQRNWLDYLAKAGRWQDWLVAYQRLPIKSAAYQCGLASAYMATGQQQTGLELATRLWLEGEPQPKECDPLFEQWKKTGKPTASMVTIRYWRAIQAREMRLARYLHRYMDTTSEARALEYEAMLKHPDKIVGVDISVYPQEARDMLVKLYFQRQARKNLEVAAQQWLEFRPQLPAGSGMLADLDMYIGKRLSYEQTDSAYQLLGYLDPAFQYSELTEARLRQLMSAEVIDWNAVLTMIGKLPADIQSDDRWVYWKIHGLENQSEAVGQQDELWNQLAQSRSFYGFLAAARLNLPYQLNDVPPVLDSSVLTDIANNPAVIRASEWLKLDQQLEASQEWNSARSAFNDLQRQHLAALSRKWSWHHRAIIDAIQQQQWNYLDARFPALFGELFDAAASKNEIDSNWATAIARQESAFNPQARSGVGARGLMQLMPTTARHTARKHSLAFAKTDQLYRPETNIALGTAYLADMYQRFDHNRAYASAAYNAGPHRVERWLKERGNAPLDVWIETIPFAETRQYVQNVLAFRVIYAQRAGLEVAMLSPSERLLLAYQQQAETTDADTVN
ncbi:transglycosylase SLT domain-containing protein [Oceanobacter mangrovi]|uniref:transglycosylase SLT domain-containing protein n=1 Tax=Oceanobacter mangrovi TaxID=2862510 RepID=UPI001C8E759B|nr:transglycosylase SLT domain-containing protein [Oceanobacter mangrovi]